jgi:MaoC dehydratase-like protein
MPLNRELVGKRYDPRTYVVDAQRVSSFASAIGHDGDGVPPTFVTAPEIQAGLANVIADPDVGMELSRVLHGEQEYEWSRGLEIGETVTAAATIDDIRGRPSLEFLTLRTEIRGADGTLVCLATSMLIHRAEP